MTIGIVLAKPPGYSETFFNSKIKGLQENGHEVVLFTGPCKESYRVCTHKESPRVHKILLLQICNMIFVGLRLLPHLKAVQKFVELEREESSSVSRIFKKIYNNSHLLKFKGDWLHYGFATLAIDRELVAEAIGAKMAVSFRGFDLNVYPLKHPGCYQLLWNKIDKVQSISEYLLEKGYALGLDKTVPCQIISPAIDLNTLPKREENKTSNPIKIVTIARFNWMKGIDYLIEVAYYLKNEGFNFEWHLIGSGHNLESERYVFHIHQRGLERYVILKGRCSHHDTLNMLASADIYVQTSLNEGFCNAVLEAQALGVPCVAFRVGGLPENIKDNETGWLIAPYDVKAMAQRIITISCLAANEKSKISENAIKRVEEHYDLERQKRGFKEFYN